MKKYKTIIYKNFIQKKYLKVKLSKKLNKNFEKIIKNITLNLDNDKNIFHTLSKNFKLNFKLNDISKFKKFNNIAVIGMGGSILGVSAINSFLEKKIKKNLIFFDNLNDDQIKKLKKKYNLNKILFLVISKSGSTVETLTNLLVLKIVKKNSKNIIIISEKNNNPLFLLSKEMGLFHIEHKNYIGGRFSILSEVGMVPAYLMGLNVFNFRINLLNHFYSNNKKFLKESSIKLTNIYKNNKFKSIIFMNYVPQLNNFLYWNQQLMAESLGKKGKGILPMISLAPKDHHSLLQLYLEGPKDKLFYIFSDEIKNRNKNKINHNLFGKKFNFLKNKNLDEIKMAQKKAFIIALKKNKIPFREFKILDFNEKILGELFSYFMIETAIIGILLNIDPFNQPAVEQVKKDTIKILT